MARQPKPWRRGGGPWYSQVGGRKVWLAGPAAGRAEAQAALHRVIVEEAKGKRPAGDITVSRLLWLYLEHSLEETTQGLRTVGNHEVKQRMLSQVDAIFGARPALSLQPRDVLAWLATKVKWGPSTRAGAVRYVKAMYRWGHRVGHLESNPIAQLTGPTPKIREKILTEEQAADLLARAKQPFKDLLFALLETGCRPGEIAGLTADRVDLDAGTWQVLNKIRGKTGQTYRTIYLTPAMVKLTRKLLKAHPTGHVFRCLADTPWTRTVIGRRFIRLRGKDGGEVCAYACRHRYATRALANGLSAATVATLMGHRRVDVLLRVYSHLAEDSDRMRQAAAQARVKPSSRPSKRAI